MEIEKATQFMLETQAKHEITIQQWDEAFLNFQQENGELFRTLVSASNARLDAAAGEL